MSGYFQGIVGKTIQGVYCRDNEGLPKAQVFLIFDDGTYFEIYSTSYGGLNGTKGIDKGDMVVVENLSHRQGEVVCKFEYEAEPVRSMWYPVLEKYSDKTTAMGVPSHNIEVTSYEQYCDLLANHLQGLIEQIDENEARELIEAYLLDGSELIQSHSRENWAEAIMELDEMDMLLADIQAEHGHSSSIADFKPQQNSKLKEANITEITLENLLKTIQKKFVLTNDDRYIIERTDEMLNQVIKNINLSPANIVRLGKLLYVLRKLPQPLKDVHEGFRLTTSLGTSLNFNITDERLSVLIDGAGRGAELFELSIDVYGSREEEGNHWHIDSDEFRNIDSDDVFSTEDYGDSSLVIM